MKILGIETSCDETAAAVVEATKDNQHVVLLSNAISTSMQLHEKTGGIIPEQAARQQIQYILPVIQKALTDANVEPQDLDAIAVTYGPGLIGSLLVGVETARTLSYIWNKPIIPVNHLIGHIYANWITNKSTDYRLQTTALSKDSLLAVDRRQWTVDQITFPALGIVVSGGHTDIVLLKNHADIQVIGGTRDDAAGECFDKCARLLGYAYPGGPKIAALAKKGNPKAFHLPRPMMHSGDYDFSFSGLKTAFLRLVHEHFPLTNTPTHDNTYQWQHIVLEKAISTDEKKKLYDLCASLQQAIIDVLTKKILKAAETYAVQSILIGGGVAANESLIEQLKRNAGRLRLNATVFVPPKFLCTDNAAMIAAAACFNKKEVAWKDITASPELYFD